MLTFFTIVIMLAVAYVYLTEDVGTACFMFCNTIAAGLITFNFFEPMADFLETMFTGSIFAGYEDALGMVFLFSLSLGVLRLATNNVANNVIDVPPLMHRIAAPLFGAWTGYLVCGFLICMMQTLPWHENFMFFDAKYTPDATLRRYLPPDRVWLALMQRAGAYAFADDEDPETSPAEADAERTKKYKTFDQYGSFEIRYARYRRYKDKQNAQDKQDPVPYYGEFDRELHRLPKPGG